MTANLTSTPKRQRINQEETKGKNEIILNVNLKNERNNGSLLTIRTNNLKNGKIF